MRHAVSTTVRLNLLELADLVAVDSLLGADLDSDAMAGAWRWAANHLGKMVAAKPPASERHFADEVDGVGREASAKRPRAVSSRADFADILLEIVHEDALRSRLTRAADQAADQSRGDRHGWVSQTWVMASVLQKASVGHWLSLVLDAWSLVSEEDALFAGL